MVGKGQAEVDKSGVAEEPARAICYATAVALERSVRDGAIIVEVGNEPPFLRPLYFLRVRNAYLGNVFLRPSPSFTFRHV